MKCTVETASGGMIYIPSLTQISSDIQVISKNITATICKVIMLILLMGNIYGVYHRDGLRCHYIYIVICQTTVGQRDVE